MDTATRRRLTLGFLSNWINRMAGTVIQLVQVPLFLHFWGKALYGEWLIVSAIPTYLAFSNVGFGNVAANEMTMMMGRGDQDGALRVFQSCWWLINSVCAFVVALLAAVIWFLPVAHWAHLSVITNADARWMLLALGAAVMFGQLEQLLGGAYTCIGRYPYGTAIRSVLNLAGYAIMFIPVVMGYGARTTAIVFGLDNLAQTLILALMVRRDMKWIRYGWGSASWAEIKRLAPPAFAFMGFPMGFALNIQGTLLAVGWVLGPTEVVIFGTARTVSRIAFQMVQLVNTTFWPEMSAAFGAGNIPLVRALHRRACQSAIIVAITLLVGIYLFGPWFLAHWTLHQLPPGRTLLLILMLSVFFYAAWSTSATLLQAINRHQRLAGYFLGATGATLIVTYFAAKYGGLLAAAGSLVLSELLMNFYVLPTSLRLCDDTFGGWLAAMLDFPAALRPSALRRRFQRAERLPADQEDVQT